MNFTENQKKAIQANRPVVGVSAGAGSGKTAILVERIVYLLSNHELWGGVQPGLNRIAAITFTDKAAAEMKARLRRRFKQEVQGCADPDRMLFWRSMEHQVESAHISTIHSFCAAVLRENALHFNRDPDWKVLKEVEAARAIEGAITDTLNALLEQNDPSACRLALQMSRQEIKSVLKKMLLNRWDYLAVWEDMPVESADQLFDRWEKSFPLLYRSFLQKLKHAPQLDYFLSALQEFDGASLNPSDVREKARASYIRALTAIKLGQEDSEIFLNEINRDFLDLRHSSKGWDKELFKALGVVLGQTRDWIKEQVLCPERLYDSMMRSAENTFDFWVLFRKANEKVQQIRNATASLDFDDMINETLYFLKSDPDLCRRIALSYSFLLIDEFQDTDSRQLSIARMLADVAGGPSLFYVGDAKQSIYLFRGADVSLFNGEMGRDSHAVSMQDNFRTLPDVLHFVNDFFVRSNLLSSVEAYGGMAPQRTPLKECRVECFITESKENVEMRRRAEAAFIAGRIAEMCGGETAVQVRCSNDRDMRPASYDDIVLLFRRGSQIHFFESALRAARIPYNRIAGEGFFKRREVLDVIAMLKWVLDPWDEEAMLGVLRSPFVGLSDEDLMSLARTEKGLAASFHDDTSDPLLKHPERLAQGRLLFRDLYRRREWPPARWLDRLLSLTCYESVLMDHRMGLQRVSNLRKLRKMAENFSQTDLDVLTAFVEYLEEQSVRELKEGEAELQSKGMGAVTIMTVHKAKGLEFPVVFLPDLDVGTRSDTRDKIVFFRDNDFAVQFSGGRRGFEDSGFYQLLRRINRLDNQLELARILYVAMTRARDYLVLCSQADATLFTWAGILNRMYALPDRADGEVLCDDNWQLRIRREQPIQPYITPERKEYPVPDEDRILARLQSPANEEQAKRCISVSALLDIMGFGEDQEEAKRNEFREASEFSEGEDSSALIVKRAAAMDRGTLFHRIFELWDFKKDLLPPLDELIHESGLDFREAKEFRATMEEAIAVFRRSDSWRLFSGAGSIEREMPFLLKLDDCLLKGVIDAVIDQRIIVDYKTGHAHPDSRERYRTQVMLYGAALWKIRGILPAKGLLWYVDQGFSEEFSICPADLEEVMRCVSLNLQKC